MLKLQRFIWLLFPLLVGIGLDQITKSMARDLLIPGHVTTYVHGLIQLHYIENHGGFLGYLNAIPIAPRFWLLTIGVGFTLLAASVWLIFQESLTVLQRIVAALVLAGGTSNLLDRIFNDGGVIDFISIGTEPLKTGIFNLADVWILVGAFYLGFTYTIRK